MSVLLWQGPLYNMMMLGGSVVSGVMVFLAGDWVSVWCWFEVNFIFFLGLLLLSPMGLSCTSGVVYFVMQGLGSSFFLAGALMWQEVSWGGLMVGVSLFLKIGVFPFHWWVPMVAVGANWKAFMGLTVWQKLAPVGLLSSVECYSMTGSGVVLFVGGLSVVVGALGGYSSSSVVELISYSSISHSGWMVLGWVCGSAVPLIYLMVYSSILLGLMVTLDTREMAGVEGWGLDGGFRLDQYVAVALLSLGGVPPLSGFFLKLYVLKGLVLLVNPVWGLMIISVSLCNLYFYLKMVWPRVVIVDNMSCATKVMGSWGTFFMSFALIYFPLSFSLFLFWL